MKLPEPFFAPGKVIFLLRRSVAEGAPNVSRLRHQGLPLVKGLGAYFPRMIDAHESRRVTPRVIIKVGRGKILGRGRALGGHGAGHGS